MKAEAIVVAAIIIVIVALAFFVGAGRRRIEERCVELGGNPGECHAIAWSPR